MLDLRVKMGRYYDGSIEDGGQLFLKRGSEYKQQCCAFTLRNFCADDCSHFGEPVEFKDLSFGDKEPLKTIHLQLCQNKILVFDREDFEDRRK